MYKEKDVSYFQFNYFHTCLLNKSNANYEESRAKGETIRNRKQ
jgi:hypothetical protein